MGKLDFSKPLLMQIVNATPNSFSGDGIFSVSSDLAVLTNPDLQSLHEKSASKRPQNRLPASLEVSDIIDIGGESTNPLAKPVSVAQEISRILPVIDIVRQEEQRGSGQVIAVDTYKPEVASAALQAGAHMLNILSGPGCRVPLYQIANNHRAYVVIYHSFGNWTDNMVVREQRAREQHNVIDEIKQFFDQEIKIILKSGVSREKIILDPGIGFGKTDRENLEIISRLSELRIFTVPILVGLSRKGFLGRLIQQDQGLGSPPQPKDRLDKALDLTVLAVRNGANIIRTHDILETRARLIAEGLL